MSQSSRGKSSERVANTSYHSSQGVTNIIANNALINYGNGNSSSNTLKDARESQQKDLITEMKRLKKNFQELKSPTIQKKYFGVTGGVGQQQQHYQQQSSQVCIINENIEQGNNNNQQNNNSFIQQDQYNSDHLKVFSTQKGYFNEPQRQISQTRVKANQYQSINQQNSSLIQHSKGQLSDSNRNHYISQEVVDISGDQDNNQNYLNQFDKSINQSFNHNTSLYTKTIINQQQQGSESNRSYNGIGSLNNSSLNQHGYNVQQQQNIPRGSQKDYANSLYQQQQQLQSRQNNSLKRISDKINNIKDRAEKIEQIKHFEKKNLLQNQQQNGALVNSTYTQEQRDSKEIQTEDISNIFIEKSINDENIKEIERLRGLLKILEQELDSKEKCFREQEKQLQSQIDEKQSKIQDQSDQIEKVLDDLNRLQKENIKVNNALKQAQENLALNGKNQNNTSSQHLLPSEFKTKWESLVTDGVANTFINFFENPLILTNLLQDLFIIIHEISKNHIKETNSKVMDLLQLDKKHAKAYEQNLSKLYQDYNNDIFKVVADIEHPKVAAIVQKFKQQADKIVTHQYFSEFQNMKSDYIDEEEEELDQDKSSGSAKKTYKKISIFRDTIFFEQNQEDFKQYLQELYESNELLEFIEQFYRLSIHMHLHDPPLNLPIQNFKNRVFEYIPYKKNNYYLIDGFVQQNAPALTVIPSVLRNNQIYTGIKPSVILLTEDFMNERIQQKIDIIIQNEQNQYNSNNACTSKSNQSGDKTENSKTDSQTKSKDDNLALKQESPKQILAIVKDDKDIQNKNVEMIENKNKEINNSTDNSKNNSELIQEKQQLQNYQRKENFNSSKQNEEESSTDNYLKASFEKKKTDQLVNSYSSSSKDNKENQEQYINQAQIKIKSPSTQCMNNLKNISQVSQKFDSSSKKSGYLNFGYISTSPKQDLLNLISPKGSSSKKIKIENLDSIQNIHKNSSKLQEALSNSSKKKLNFDSFHSDKKLGLNSNKSGIGSPIIENCKDEIVKNLFLTSRHHYSSNTKQRDDSQNSNINFSIKSGWQMLQQSQNQQDTEKRSIFDDLTNQTIFQNNISGQISKQQPQKFINRLDNSNFLKKGSFTSKNKSSISSHMNNTYLNSMIHKQTQDSVQLLRTLQADCKKNHIVSKEDQQDSEEVENQCQQNDEKNTYNSKSKNLSIIKKSHRESNSPISNKNNKNSNDSKLNFSNAAINNDQERSRIHSNNQSSQKIRKHNKSEEENRIINQNTIFNKHFKKNSVQNEPSKNQNLQQQPQQASSMSSKPYTFNTFLENHRKNLQKNEKEQSVNYQQDSSPRERIQSKGLNISFKEQQNKQMVNSSRLYKKDSFEFKSNNSNQHSFSRQNQEPKQSEKNKFSGNDFYSNLRKQINNQQHLGGIQNESYEQQSKENSKIPLKSSRDISPSQIQLNCSKTDRLLKYSDQNQIPYDTSSHQQLQKSSNSRTVTMKRALQNIINSFSSDDNEDQNIQMQAQKKLRDSDDTQDDSLIEELNLQKSDNNLNRQISGLNKNTIKGESNENRPFSHQSGLHIQPQHKKNKTFEKLYNDLKQKKPFLQNAVKPSKELLYKI
ncbi:HMG box protein (macronuclear) [Tetrahymena thermophila SB210]|uniref:HMG box protein n=1 Tax=Tetrahymena thermophila (strain SB210) TaxID=312017 RepID=I7M3Q9_TETTS|nr:HMG box protein [Tetrahymena thermophila SB210]EAS03921.2 HMG box protein [Tetrahymena thermophila SB210]|eukprot:XP_001024166.2 HMG box protein [Tetrahymena thermophila SB210]